MRAQPRAGRPNFAASPALNAACRIWKSGLSKPASLFPYMTASGTRLVGSDPDNPRGSKKQDGLETPVRLPGDVGLPGFQSALVRLRRRYQTAIGPSACVSRQATEPPRAQRECDERFLHKKFRRRWFGCPRKLAV